MIKNQSLSWLSGLLVFFTQNIFIGAKYFYPIKINPLADYFL